MYIILGQCETVGKRNSKKNIDFVVQLSPRMVASKRTIIGNVPHVAILPSYNNNNNLCIKLLNLFILQRYGQRSGERFDGVKVTTNGFRRETCSTIMKNIKFIPQR